MAATKQLNLTQDKEITRLPLNTMTVPAPNDSKRCKTNKPRSRVTGGPIPETKEYPRMRDIVKRQIKDDSSDYSLFQRNKTYIYIQTHIPAKMIGEINSNTITFIFTGTIETNYIKAPEAL
ncbi:hypothetical protein DFP73DRAFT_599097 [Morchella snyderi]|nr:hypothetical protein DFP73DRAFT_599097 [Morchella snyderi]